MLPGFLDLLEPLISSTPILSSPTVGRSIPNRKRAIASPIIAKSTSCSASAPIVAPTSSTMLSLRRVGQMAAIAGRSMPAMVLQAEARHRHEGAGIAGRNGDVGLAVASPPRSTCHIDAFPRPLPQRLARLVVHRHENIGVTDFRRAT